MILEIARFWRVWRSGTKPPGVTRSMGVMGPDEYHDMVPDADTGGLRNNAYTNVMVVWVLERPWRCLIYWATAGGRSSPRKPA